MVDYVRERIEFTTQENLRVPAYVLIPKNCNDQLSAVLALHGHGYGSRDIAGLNPDGSVKAGDSGVDQNFAVELVKRGMVVIAPEVIGFGDRRLPADREKGQVGIVPAIRLPHNC